MTHSFEESAEAVYGYLLAAGGEVSPEDIVDEHRCPPPNRTRSTYIHSPHHQSITMFTLPSRNDVH